MKFGDAGGWNVITSSELSDDGKARTEKTLASTEGVTAIKGGQKAFVGKNEELKSERFDGDANNYTYTTGESSNMVLNENVVTGDEMNTRIENKSSSVSHTSKVIRSSTNSSDATDNSVKHHQIIQDHDLQNTVKSSNNFESSQNVSKNAEKLSQDPAVVQEAFRLAQQPGKVLSRNVERANDTQNMITERKELSDGTIVTTKRYEPISSQYSDIQATKTTTSNMTSSKSTKNGESTTPRDEEAFRLSQQPGNLISRDITITDNNTRVITEKKELADGTIVTTKRFEPISDVSNNVQSETQKLNQTFKSSRDEEAFRLSQQPGKIISRDVTMANPTTKMIVEKKELTDGTIVTTKRYESVDSSSGDSKTVKNITKEHHHNVDEFAKSLRSDSHSTTTSSTINKNESEKNFRTSRDEEAFKLAQQPGKIISRDVSMTNPTTRMIVEKKELNDGTIVTTKKFESVQDNLDTQNVKKTVINSQNVDTRKTSNDFNTQREAVEDTIVKKIFDTSCQCPDSMHDHKTRDFINKERSNDQYNVESEIITSNQQRNHEEVVRREEIKKIEQQKVIEEQIRKQEQKITKHLENDSAHKAFASSLRSVTPPLEKTSSTRIDRRSPSRETTSSKISSSTTTIKRNSNVDIRKNDDFMRSTQSSDRRSTSMSPEKQVKKISKSTELIIDSEKAPQKFTDTPRSASPSKGGVKKPVASKVTRENSPTKNNFSSKSTPSSRESSPIKNNTREKSPQKQNLKPSEYDEILTATVKIDNIDKNINDLKIVQTIDTKDLSATTSVSDLEYMTASEHKRMITDLDSEDITVKINIENANLLDDLQIKTTICEAKKPFNRNRSETFEERAKKLIGMKSDDEVVAPTAVKKEVPNYAKPTKASKAPVATKDANRVSEIRERKAKIEEISSVNKNHSINDFIKFESECDCSHPSSPERSPIRKKTSEGVINKKASEITNRLSSPKKTTEINKPTKNTDKKVEERRSRSPTTRTKSPETHITTAQITISPSRGITSKIVTKTSTVDSHKTLKVAPSIKLIKRTSDISSTEPDSETDLDLIRNIDKSSGKNIRKKLIQSRKDSAPVTKTTTSSQHEKVSRSISDNLIKVDACKKSGTRDSPKRDSKRPTKCITTKTINLTNLNDTTTLNSSTLDNVEIDITVQQAKSSREPSPNRIVPIPVHTDDEINEEETLHPNMVTEPDDDKKKIKSKVINVPIFQEETKQFVGLEITEVGTEKSQTILEEDETTEDSEVIHSSSLEKADHKRNSIQIDAIDEDENDDSSHLLSVSQKVNKFNETVEELKKPKASSSIKKENIFKLEDVPDSDDDDEFLLTTNEKVSKFTKSTSEDKTLNKKDIMTRSLEVDENLKNDECLLSVSDKVNKFIASAERLSSPVPQRSPELVKNVMNRGGKGKVENISDSFLKHERNDKATKSSEISLKSTEAIKKAREVFESNSSAKELNRQKDILSRPSVFEEKRSSKVDRKNSQETTPVREEKSPDRRSPSKTPSPTPRRGSGDRTPVYMKDQVSTKKDLFEKRISSSKIENEIFHQKSLSPQTSVDEKRRRSSTDDSQVHQVTRKISNTDKHYMQHTVASLEHVISTEIRDAELHRTTNEIEHRRESSKSPSKRPSISESIDQQKTPTMFGVELKRTDSYKARKTSACSETLNIEEIWDLTELEKLLEIVVGYEQRRRIRAQIRIVKKKIDDKKLSMEIKSSRKSSANYSSPARSSRTENVKSVEKPSRDSRVQSVTTTTTTTTKYSAGDKNPDQKVTSTRSTQKVLTSSPREIIESMNKSTKGKVTENVVKTAVRKTSATSNTATQKKSSNLREQKSEIDCITSSYGVGPTDSNGLPLFGLKALRKKGSITESKSS